MDVVGGSGDGLLEPREEAVAVDQQVERAVLAMGAGVAIHPRLPLREVHARAVGQRGDIAAGLGQGEPHEPDDRLDAQIAEPRHAGDRVLEQRQSVAFEQQRAEALAVVVRPSPARCSRIPRPREEHTPGAARRSTRSGWTKRFADGAISTKSESRGCSCARCPLDHPSDNLQGFVDGETVFDHDVRRVLTAGGQVRNTLRVAIKQAADQERLVIEPVAGGLRGQLGDEVGGQPAPVRPRR